MTESGVAEPSSLDILFRRRISRYWEADLLIFRRAHGQANVTSLVGRKSRLVRLIPNSNRCSACVIRAIGQALAELLLAARQSITFDRGSAFLSCAELNQSHGINSYFCDPHAPWPKGSVKNTNGRLRRSLPGELDLARNCLPLQWCLATAFIDRPKQ